MASLLLSEHAKVRMKQRAIPPFVIEILEQYGEVEAHKGCAIFRFSKRALHSLESYFGKDIVSAIKKYSSCYAVYNDGLCVTVARQNTHHKRDRN
jgi:hypothetical protein